MWQGGTMPGSRSQNQARWKRRERGTGENQKQVFTGFPTPLETSPKTRDFHFPAAPTTASSQEVKGKGKTKKVAA
jgi:hypothetical protein